MRSFLNFFHGCSPGPDGWQPSHPALDNPVWDPSGDLRPSDVAVARPCPSADAPPPAVSDGADTPRTEQPRQRAHSTASGTFGVDGQARLSSDCVKVSVFSMWIHLGCRFFGGFVFDRWEREEKRRRNGAEHRGRRLDGWLAGWRWWRRGGGGRKR